MPDDQIQAGFTRSRPLADTGLGANLPADPRRQADTTTASPPPRAATTTWQAFVPCRPQGMDLHAAFSSEPGSDPATGRTFADAAGRSTIGHAGGGQCVDMDALRFQLAIYQSGTHHPQCAVLADLCEEAASSGELELDGISPAAVDQMPEEVWEALRGFVTKLQVSPDTSHETEQRWRTALDLPNPATESGRARKRPRLEEIGLPVDVDQGPKRRAIGGLSSAGQRPAERIVAPVAPAAAQPTSVSFQPSTVPAAIETRNLKALDLLSANPAMPTHELTTLLNASAASWPAVSASVVSTIKRDFTAMKAVSQGATPQNTASHVYAIARGDPRLTAEKVCNELALRIAPKIVGILRVATVLSLMRTAIDNGHLPGTPVRSSAAAAAKESAGHDLEVLRMLAKSPSISSTLVAARLGENAPSKLNALKSLLIFVRIVHSAHHRAAGEALAPLDRIYTSLRDDEKMRADDPASIKALEDIWKQSDRQTSDFRRFRSLCLLAIDNKVFEDADDHGRGQADPPV